MRGIGVYARNQKVGVSQIDLVRLLFGEAVRRLRRLETYTPDDPRWIEDCHHVRAIVVEFLTALDAEKGGAYVDRMVPIYEWAIHTLLEASRSRDTAEITPLREVFETLQQGWHGLDAGEAGAA